MEMACQTSEVIKNVPSSGHPEMFYGRGLSGCTSRDKAGTYRRNAARLLRGYLHEEDGMGKIMRKTMTSRSDCAIALEQLTKSCQAA
jgi:hypothetical protein